MCAYFCTYLDLYNVSLQGNRIQTYSICTLLHLLIKEASQKSQPIHFLLSSCAIYTEKYCAYTYIYTQYIHLYIYHWEITEPAMLASHYMLCTEYTSIRYIEMNIYMYVYIYIYIFMYSIHLDLYNVGFQGNQVQIYSICTLLHLFIKNVSRKHSPSISCLVLAQYMLKNIVYIYLIYVYICTYTI